MFCNEAARFLLCSPSAAGIDINAKMNDGYTPLMTIKFGHYDTACEIPEYILANVADINARNIHGKNALSIVVNVRDTDMIRFFAGVGADIHNGLMSLAIYLWKRGGSEESVILLAEIRISMSSRDGLCMAFLM